MFAVLHFEANCFAYCRGALSEAYRCSLDPDFGLGIARALVEMVFNTLPARM
jgi:hypothetical protein